MSLGCGRIYFTGFINSFIPLGIGNLATGIYFLPIWNGHISGVDVTDMSIGALGKSFCYSLIWPIFGHMQYQDQSHAKIL